MATNDRSALEPALRDAKEALKEALGTACSADIEHADTGELIRVEEVLAIANEAAKQAVSVRRRLNAPSRAARTTPARGTRSSEANSREIEDATGVRWMVFAVYPSSAAGRPTVREQFREGWLSFDSGEQTRRIAPIPEQWTSASDEELLQLWDRAEVVRRRSSPRSSGESQASASA